MFWKPANAASSVNYDKKKMAHTIKKAFVERLAIKIDNRQPTPMRKKRIIPNAVILDPASHRVPFVNESINKKAPTSAGDGPKTIITGLDGSTVTNFDFLEMLLKDDHHVKGEQEWNIDNIADS